MSWVRLFVLHNRRGWLLLDLLSRNIAESTTRESGEVHGREAVRGGHWGFIYADL